MRFWEQRDHLSEGSDTLARVLTMPGAEARTRARARVLYGATVLADIQGDLATARRLAGEACDIYREFGDANGIATTMTAMAWQAQRQGLYDEATSLFGETVSAWDQLGEVTAVDLARSNMANAAKAGKRYDLARTLLAQVLEASRARSDVRGIASALNGLGDLAAAQGEHEAARRYHHQSLAGYRKIDDQWGLARVLTDLANIDLQLRDYAAAEASVSEALHAFRALGHQRGVARQLESLAWCAGCQSRDHEAVALASAAAAIRFKVGTPAKPPEQEKIDETLAAARARLSPDAFAAAWRFGRTASLDTLPGIGPGGRA
jgi:tetratricopeptide (TPR) repeat protein